MSPALLLSVVRNVDAAHRTLSEASIAEHLCEKAVADRLTVLGQLTDSERNGLWPAPTEWELKTGTYSAYCFYCCKDDLSQHRPPFGRHIWQQSWYTICQIHGIALVFRSYAHKPANRSFWSSFRLGRNVQYSHADRYRWQVIYEPAVKPNILACLVEIERSTAEALSGITPNFCLWGKLSAAQFLMVLGDLTTWSLTHFEPVRCWSAAEELTPTEVQEGQGLIGRTGRMSGSDYGEDQSTRGTVKNAGVGPDLALW